MFKLYDQITKITTISGKGFNIAYQEPKDNKDFLELVAKNRFSK